MPEIISLTRRAARPGRQGRRPGDRGARAACPAIIYGDGKEPTN